MNNKMDTIEIVIPHDDRFQIAYKNADASTAKELLAAESGKEMCITALMVSVDAELDIIIQDEDATAIVEEVYCQANGGYVYPIDKKTPLTVPAGKALQVKASGAGKVSVNGTGYYRPVS